MAVHLARGTTTGTNARMLPDSVPCLVEFHEAVDRPVCITLPGKDKWTNGDKMKEAPIREESS